jgi:MFS transporter, CP family, cyanate transporter
MADLYHSSLADVCRSASLDASHTGAGSNVLIVARLTKPALALAALFLLSAGMRSQLSGLPPLLPQIESDLGTTHAWGGLLVSLSFAMMGVGALAASATLRLIGSVRGIAVATIVIVLSGIARAIAPDAVTVAAIGVPIGLAVGLVTALMPVVTKERFAHRPGLATGVYVLGLSVGSSVYLATAAPIADATGGWRPTLLAFGAITLLLAAPWFALTREGRVTIAGVPRLGRPTSMIWFPIAIFTLQSALFFGLSTWLPSAYVEHGWTETSAGLLGSGLVLSSLFGSLAISPLADSRETTGRYLIVAALIAAVGCLGLVMLPDAPWVWTLLAGAATGALLVLSLKLPLDLFDNVDDVAAVSGLMLAIGYTLSGSAPLLLGVLREATGSFAMSFAALGLLSVAGLLVSIRRVASAAPA